MSETSRTRHYGHFYGIEAPKIVGRVALVLGNCQAESLRIMLQGDDVTAIRMPPVHELTAADIPHLDGWLARADTVISQPIRDDYHGLPVGMRQIEARLPHGEVLVVPVIRFAGLYPLHAIVRPPRDASLVPPVVEYHDLSTLAKAAGSPLPPLTASRVRAVAAQSLAELRRREEANATVVVSDLFDSPDFGMMRTLNHPGNSIWTPLASRVRNALGLDEKTHNPGRPLLASVHAPRLSIVIETFDLDASPTDHWKVGESIVAADDVERAHLAWYADNPDIVAAGIERHRATLALLAG